MHVIDRFTRDDVSAKVWWPLAMVLVVLLIVTFPAQDRQTDRIHEDAVGDAVSIVRQIVDPAVVALGGTADPAAAAALDETLIDDVLEEDATVRAIRLWAEDGRLLFSTDDADSVGSEAAVNDEQIAAAMDAPNRTVAFTTDVGLSGGSAPPGFVVYRALDGAGAVAAQVEFDDDALLADQSARWFAWRIALAAMTLLVLALALLSMREPLARSGAGVKFYPTSVPPGAAVIDGDDASVLRQAEAHARRRVHEMQGRMEDLELEKVRLEGELQRALSARTLGASAPAPAIPRVVEHIETPAVELPELAVDEPGLPPAPVRPAAETEPAPARRRRSTRPEPVDEPAAAVPEPPPPAHEPEPEPAIQRVAEPEAEPEVAEPARPAARTRQPRPVPEDAWAAPAGRVVEVPEVERSPDSDEDVIAVLHRLVEPVGAGAANVDAASDLRARLARTSARKKPGSRSDDRFEHHEPS